MKQVAKKSTTSIPRKISAGNHQQNGLIPLQESSKEKSSASNTLSASSGDGSALGKNCGDRLTNGLHDSSEGLLGNGPGCSNTDKASTARDIVQKQTVEHSTSTVTSVGDLHHSATNVPLPLVPQASSNAVSSKSLNDVPAKHDSAETARSSSSSRTASAAVGTASKSQNDVIIVKDKDDTKPSVRCLKRPRLDGAMGHSVKAGGNDDLSRKVRIILDVPFVQC